MDIRRGESSQRNTDFRTAVEFVYRPTAADFEEALRARARRSPAGRAQALMAPLVAAIAVTVFSAVQEEPLAVWIISLVLAVPVAFWATARGLRTMARRMFSMVEPYGQCQTVANDRGAVTTGERASFSMDWTVFREYLETPGLFVLLGGDRAAGVALLPKRGAQDPADVDRLRAILERNLKRL
ncbi:YcxB family protein [Streptomyces coeruleorubidus]|uniref:YcxB family protein n=1 Tax=Streptomyces coeruleorubidus TaxID=116188 RepID=UPI0036FC4035